MMTAVYIILDIFKEVIHELALIVAGKYMFEESIKTDRTNLILLAADIIITWICVYFGKELGILVFYLLNIISYIILTAVFLRGKADKSMLRRFRAMIESLFLYSCTYMAYSGVFFVMTASVPQKADIFYVVNTMSELQYGKYRSAMTVLCALYILYMYFTVIKKGINLNLKWKTRAMLIIFSFVCCVGSGMMMLYRVEGIDNETLGGATGFMSVCMVAMCLLMPAFAIKNQTSTLFETGQKHHQEMLNLQIQHFEQYKDAQEETRRFRHDILNDLRALQILQNEGKNDEARKYVDELLGQVSALTPKVVTGSEMLDCIICSKTERMEQSGINFEIDGVFDHGLKMSSKDMCTIFANAIDNAIEACEKIADNRFFEMRIKKTASYYVIAMKNSMAESENTGSMLEKIRFTTKKNKEFHGYGLGNIRKTVEKHGGDTSVKMENGMFVLNIMLPIT